MQYKEQIQTLRQSLSISLNRASDLLKQAHGDTLSAQTLYHDEQIAHIAHMCQCDINLAREQYERYQHNAEKAIAEINSRPLFFSIDNRPFPKRCVAFFISAMDEDFEPFANEKILMVSMEDFACMADEFETAFPLYQPLFDEVQQGLDYTSRNIFDNDTCKNIIARLRLKTYDDPKTQAFVNQVLAWFDEKLSYAPYIELDGNL